jgi:hypothetical protein
MEFYRCQGADRVNRHKALSHWFTGASWGNMDEDEGDFGHITAVVDRTAARFFLNLRLVCRAMDIEASALLFRKVTVCWSVWSSADVLLLRDLAKGQVAYNASEAKRLEEVAQRDEQSTSIHTDEPKPPLEVQTGFACASILDWIGRFRRTRVFVQDGCLDDLLEGLDNILALSSRPRIGLQLPSVELVICNFKLVFGMGTSSARQSRRFHNVDPGLSCPYPEA